MEAEGTKEPDCRLRMFADDGVICVESRLQEEGKQRRRWRWRWRGGGVPWRRRPSLVTSVASVNQK